MITLHKVGASSVLVDQIGRSLYLFTKDKPGVSECTGDCATKWPPATGHVQAGTGVDAANLGIVTRADGSTQITYAGMPLYYFAQDTTAGEIKGEGKMNVWYLVDAAGKAVKGAVASAG